MQPSKAVPAGPVGKRQLKDIVTSDAFKPTEYKPTVSGTRCFVQQLPLSSSLSLSLTHTHVMKESKAKVTQRPTCLKIGVPGPLGWGPLRSKHRTHPFIHSKLPRTTRKGEEVEGGDEHAFARAKEKIQS